MKVSKLRGNDIYFDNKKSTWVFSKDGSLVTTQYDELHPCGNCGKNYTKEGHDACLGTLIGVMNACCGHGNIDECYIQFLDGECIRGEDARVIINVLKKYRKENR